MLGLSLVLWPVLFPIICWALIMLEVSFQASLQRGSELHTDSSIMTLIVQDTYALKHIGVGHLATTQASEAIFFLLYLDGNYGQQETLPALVSSLIAVSGSSR